ncbi:MAG TPA: hypothetical protein VJ917_03870, partial [Saprospiraceae bacterium]|nr:hypothetical protein [Saprospiraceae bacterium]
SGLVVKQLAGSSLDIDSTGLDWTDLIIATDESNIQGILKMTNKNGYSSWLNFEDEVRMNGVSTNSYLTFSDLYYFAPALKKNTFINQNRNQSFVLDGRFQGYLNRLRIRDINLKHGGQSRIEGQLTLRDITNPQEAFISLRVENMYSNVQSITSIFPDLRIPSSFNRLGGFRFEGSFDGSPSDFIAYGSANTGLGIARLDINVENLNTDLETSFSGVLSLKDFDLKNWLNNDELGKMSMTAEVALGKGLKLENAEATLDAVVEYIDYKGYRYKDINYAGRFSKRLLDGKGEIVDDNVRMNYSGVVQRRDSSYTVNAKINLENANLKALNFSEDEATISTQADLNFKTNRLLDFIGYAKLDSLHLQTENSYNTIGNVDIYSLEYGEGQHLNVIGDGFDLRIDGDFRLIDFYKPLLNTFNEQNTQFNDLINIPRFTQLKDNDSQFEIQLKLDSLIGWPQLWNKDMKRLDDLDLFLAYDQDYDYIRFESSTETLNMGQRVVYNPSVFYDVRGRSGEAKITVDSIQLGESFIPPVNVAMEMENEELQFAILSTDIYEKTDYLNITGEISRKDSFYVFHLNEGILALFNEYWNIATGNYLMLAKNSIKTKNFILTGMNGQQMMFKSLGEKGLKVVLEGFDITPVNAFIPIEALQVGGLYKGSVAVMDLFRLRDFEIDLSSDEFQINHDPYGRMSLTAYAEDLHSI